VSRLFFIGPPSVRLPIANHPEATAKGVQWNENLNYPDSFSEYLPMTGSGFMRPASTF
jgi:hypothetical protein